MVVTVLTAHTKCSKWNNIEPQQYIYIVWNINNLTFQYITVSWLIYISFYLFEIEFPMLTERLGNAQKLYDVPCG